MTKPIVRIKSLEETPAELDEALISGFLHTSYTVFSWGLAFRIGRLEPLYARWLAQRGTTSFAFITAWNPDSTRRSGRANDQQNRALARLLERAGLPFWPAFHHADDPDAPSEASFWIENIDGETAVGLGRQFEQNAIVYWTVGGVPEIWWVF